MSPHFRQGLRWSCETMDKRMDSIEAECDRWRQMAERMAQSLDDLLFHGSKWPNGVMHEADPEVAKQVLKDYATMVREGK